MAVGFASTDGLAWLARLTQNRKVRLLIGNCRPRYFKQTNHRNRKDALAFLAREDVEVWNWYRRHGQPSEAHLKIWIAHSRPFPAALNGSANLSEAGLYHNHELMTTVSEEEIEPAIRMVEDLIKHAWNVKARIRQYIQGELDVPGEESYPQPPKPTSGLRSGPELSPSPEAHLETPAYLGREDSYPRDYEYEDSPAAPRKRRAPARKRRRRAGCGCGALVIGLLAVVVGITLLASLFSGWQSSIGNLLDRGTLPSDTQSVSTAPTQIQAPAQPGDPSDQVARSTGPTTSDPDTPDGKEDPLNEQGPPASAAVFQEVSIPLNPLANAYVQGMVQALETLTDLGRQINTVNQDWDNRSETAPTFSETEASLLANVDNLQTLSDSVRYQRVPLVLRGIHGRPEGPIQEAAKLIPLAEAVLAGLKVPAPDDGSQRREALQQFNSAAQNFTSSVEHVFEHIDKNAEALGLTANPPATPTTTLPDIQLSEEGLAYVEGLTELRDSLAELVSEINAVNQAWDDRTDNNLSFPTTESALMEVSERARIFFEQVRDHPVPRPIRGLAEDPPRKASPIAEKASEVLAGLRLPAPNSGFERLAALDDFNAAAEQFNSTVDHVISDVYAHAHTSGLAKET